MKTKQLIFNYFYGSYVRPYCDGPFEFKKTLTLLEDEKAKINGSDKSKPRDRKFQLWQTETYERILRNGSTVANLSDSYVQVQNWYLFTRTRDIFMFEGIFHSHILMMVTNDREYWCAFEENGTRFVENERSFLSMYNETPNKMPITPFMQIAMDPEYRCVPKQCTKCNIDFKSTIYPLEEYGQTNACTCIKVIESKTISRNPDELRLKLLNHIIMGNRPQPACRNSFKLNMKKCKKLSRHNSIDE